MVEKASEGWDSEVRLGDGRGSKRDKEGKRRENGVRRGVEEGQ